MKNNLFISFITIIILFLISESFVRFFFPQDLQRFWVYHEPKYGLPINKKNHKHNLHRFKSHKATYTFGKYHNRVTIKNFDNSNNPKVLVLGDSTTFGWLIDDENTFVHKLQKENLGYNFINVGVGGWGTAHYTLFTELFCEQIKPEKIFVFLNTDDFYRGFVSGHYKDINGDLIKSFRGYNDLQAPSKFDEKIPLYKFLKSNSHLFMLIRNVVYNKINEPYYNPWSKERYWARPNGEFDIDYSKKVSEFNKKIFLKLKDISEKCNSNLHLLNFMWSNYTFMQNTNPNKFFLESAKDFFKENNFNYFENSEKMSDLYNDPMKYIIKIDFHPNKDGVELIYQSLREEVNKILLN